MVAISKFGGFGGRMNGGGEGGMGAALEALQHQGLLFIYYYFSFCPCIIMAYNVISCCVKKVD